jgi:predicted RNA binding protein YcfA (HicA-like mRNA interferase family)
VARLSPVSRREFIRRLRDLGFDGPYSGGRHEFMLRADRRLILLNPHRQLSVPTF